MYTPSSSHRPAQISTPSSPCSPQMRTRSRRRNPLRSAVSMYAYEISQHLNPEAAPFFSETCYGNFVLPSLRNSGRGTVLSYAYPMSFKNPSSFMNISVLIRTCTYARFLFGEPPPGPAARQRTFHRMEETWMIAFVCYFSSRFHNLGRPRRLPEWERKKKRNRFNRLQGEVKDFHQGARLSHVCAGIFRSLVISEHFRAAPPSFECVQARGVMVF